MNFYELLKRLEATLGYHQIPLNPSARGIKDLFECSPLHHELITRLAQAIYTRNSCRKITDNVYREPSFNALSPIRLEVLRSPRSDVDVHRLVEELCVVLDRIFRESRSTPPAVPARKPSAQVIAIEPFRRSRRLKSLA